MLCRSIAIAGNENIRSLLVGAEMAEIRIEKSELTPDEIRDLFRAHPNLIATCRNENLSDDRRQQLLIGAMQGGAKWIDIEIESDDEYRRYLMDKAHEYQCKVIISYHNYENTPGTAILNTLVKDCINKGAYLVKIATMVNAPADSARLMALYDYGCPMLAIGMGPLGKITRLAALKLGAPFTFVSYDTHLETAPGQLMESEMKDLLNYL